MAYKDSMGNKLPIKILLYKSKKIDKAIKLNTFLLAIDIALDKNKKVIYDKKTKTATIIEENGYERLINF